MCLKVDFELVMPSHDREQRIRPASRRLLSNISSSEVSILTYNIWFVEEVALEQRMLGIAAVIENCGYPDFILLQVQRKSRDRRSLSRPLSSTPQEVTRNILALLSSMPWWQRYDASVPPAPQQSYFTVLCAKRATVSLSSPFGTMPFPGSQMGESGSKVSGGRGRWEKYGNFDSWWFVQLLSGRGMLYVKSHVCGYPLLVAVSHLESPIPPHWFQA